MSVPEKQAALDGIADTCRLNRNVFRLHGLGDVQFNPDATSDFEDVECAVKKLSKVRGLSKMGFVGNEALRDGVK